MAASARAAVDAALALADSPAADAVFTLRLDAEARAAADAAPGGTPITVKDNFDLAGHATTAGSTLLRSAAPALRDAPVVERLKRAGYVLLGRTNMTEFAFSGLGRNPHYGTPLNPAFPGEARIPGGSSAGAAVSVALGIVPAAIGTDTGGSVRIPAAFCGLTGFKPTARAVSSDGVLPLSQTLDAVGVIARDVAHCATVFDVIRDEPGDKRTTPEAGSIRLGVVTNFVTDGVTDEVAAAFEASCRALEAAGVTLEHVTIDAFSTIPAMLAKASFPASEAAAWHAEFLPGADDAGYDPRVLVRIRAGETMLAPDYVRLMHARRAFIAAVEHEMAGLGALLFPTVPFIAPTIESLADDKAYHATNGLALRNSSIVNLFDGCAISIPAPGGGPPVGITLAAPGGADDRLLSLAALVETIFKGGTNGSH